MAPPRWIADEMLGRLARYLRFLGHDTEYVRGLADDEVADRAKFEGRRLLTRDRLLARRVPGSILLPSPFLPEQLRTVHSVMPDAGFIVTFDRCTLCNGALRAWPVPARSAWPADVPPAALEAGRPIYECVECGHRYWEGSHTARIRAQIAGWLSS